MPAIRGFDDLNLGGELDKIPVMREVHGGRMATARRSDRKRTGLIDQLEPTHSVQQRASGAKLGTGGKACIPCTVPTTVTE
jgi:hypothetical protein